jgi:hypothetical protein
MPQPKLFHRSLADCNQFPELGILLQRRVLAGLYGPGRFDFKRRDATHCPFAIPIRGMNPTATIGHRYAISFAL